MMQWVIVVSLTNSQLYVTLHATVASLTNSRLYLKNALALNIIMMMSLQNSVANLQPAKRFKVDSAEKRLHDMFNCIICKSSPMEREPVVPPCCSGVDACKPCLQDWLAQSSTCPQCRESISIWIDVCLSIPLFRLLSTLMKVQKSSGMTQIDLNLYLPVKRLRQTSFLYPCHYELFIPLVCLHKFLLT